MIYKTISKNYEKFLTKYKWWIQVFLATLIIWIYFDPRIKLHPITAIFSILFCYVLQGYIENRILIKHLNEKQADQDEMIKIMCSSSSNFIIYKDYKGKYVFGNQVFLNAIHKTLTEIRGKREIDLFPKKDASILNNMSKKVLQGKIVKKTIKLEFNNKIYDVTSAPLVLTSGFHGIISIAKDITEEENLRLELAKQEQTTRSILLGMPVATYLKDLHGNVTYENTMAKDFLGLSDSDNANKCLYEEIRADEIVQEDAEIIKNKHCICREKLITLKNNESRWFNITKCPIINHNNEIIGICCVARDITAEKTSIEQRETYVATLTHDLKTPTIAQIKALDLLLNGNMGALNNEQKELLLLTKDSCNYMYEMLSTLLSTYKYENGDYVLNYEDCNFLSLIEESGNELDSMLKEKNMKIDIKTDGSSYNINCDRMQVKRVIMNLLGNAISYAYNNTVITVNIKKEKNNIVFNARNESAYINPALMENLFKKYVSHAAKYNKIGVGLGLYLSKQIIEAHNGQIYAKSYEDNHNDFGFTIPVDKIVQTV
ncbi:MAG: PAS domain-containing protein [bacterium]|nr:PAS domain-containing protein [bacterium]